MRQNCDYFITFGRRDLNQTEALWENFLAWMPRGAAVQTLLKYAFKDSDGKRFALMIDVNNMRGLPAEQCIVQICAQQTPPFLLGTAEYWGDELEDRLQYLRDAKRRLNDAGPENMFSHAPAF